MTDDESTSADDESGSGSSWLETIGVVIGALALALIIQQFFVKPYKIPSPSMYPTRSGHALRKPGKK